MSGLFGLRRMLWVGRAIAASIAVGAVFGILLTRRHAPETVRMISVSVRPAPLSELADTFGAEASMFRLQPIASLRFPSFPAPMNDRGSEDPSTDEAALEPADGVALTVYPEPDSGGVQPPYALVASSFGVPAAYASNARSLARFGSFYAGGSLTIPVPSAAPQRADRNLLDDLSPVITGEPAGENLCPR
jgi:hypothetical protein